MPENNPAGFIELDDDTLGNTLGGAQASVDVCAIHTMGTTSKDSVDCCGSAIHNCCE